MARLLLVTSVILAVVLGNSSGEPCTQSFGSSFTDNASETSNDSFELCRSQFDANLTSSNGTRRSPSTIDHRLTAVYIFIMILTAIGYGLLLPALFFQRKPSLLFIISLSFSDMFLAFIVVPTRVDILLGASWIREASLCRLSRCLIMFGMLPSIYGHAAISLDRLLSIKYAFWYKMNVTRARVACLCIVVWCFSLLAYVPLLGVGAVVTGPPSASCSFNKVLSIDYLIVYLAIGFIAPSTVILVAQLFLAFVIHKYMKRRRVQIFDTNLARKKASEMSRMKQEIRLQMLCLVIIIVFFGCWIPIIRGTIMNIVDPTSVTQSVVFVNGVMLFCSCFLNPFILIVGSTDIRRKIIRQLRKWMETRKKPGIAS